MKRDHGPRPPRGNRKGGCFAPALLALAMLGATLATIASVLS